MSKKALLYSLGSLIAGSLVTGLIVLLTAETASQPLTPIRPADRPMMPGRGMMMSQPDQHFMTMMIPHHEGAIAMADLALTRAQHPEIRALAESIRTSQSQEIQEMRNLYRQWYGTAVPQPGGMGMGMGMGRGRMETDLTSLRTARDFDRAFIEEMIPHHQMGVHMAQMVLARTQRPEMRQLAQAMIDEQTAEIAQMQAWYQQWYAPN